MADVLILEWLEEYDSLAESEIHTYALEQEHNYEVMVALYMLMDEHEKFTDEVGPTGLTRAEAFDRAQTFSADRSGLPAAVQLLSVRRAEPAQVCHAIHSVTCLASLDRH